MKIIDTSILIDFLRGKIDIPKDSVLTVISYYELLWKALQKNANKELTIIKRVFSFFPILNIDLNSMEKAAEIKFKLNKIGYTINDFDIIISGIALSKGINEIWTKDKDFEKITKVTELEIKIF